MDWTFASSMCCVCLICFAPMRPHLAPPYPWCSYWSFYLIFFPSRFFLRHSASLVPPSLPSVITIQDKLDVPAARVPTPVLRATTLYPAIHGRSSDELRQDTLDPQEVRKHAIGPRDWQWMRLRHVCRVAFARRRKLRQSARCAHFALAAVSSCLHARSARCVHDARLHSSDGDKRGRKFPPPETFHPPLFATFLACFLDPPLFSFGFPFAFDRRLLRSTYQFLNTDRSLLFLFSLRIFFNETTTWPFPLASSRSSVEDKWLRQSGRAQW